MSADQFRGRTLELVALEQQRIGLLHETLESLHERGALTADTIQEGHLTAA